MTDELRSDYHQTYASLLNRFCSLEDPSPLTAAASALGHEFLAAGIGPMDIKAVHDAAVAENIDLDDARALVSAHRLLLEVLLAYGVAYSAHSERLLAEADAAEQARAQGAERAEQNRLGLLAGVSHELGSPLMVVQVNVASIRKFLEERGSWPEDLNEREADVDFAIKRMMLLREQLLAASRDEQRELEIAPLPLPHALRRVVRWGQLNASAKSIELTLDCAPDLPYVMADDTALESILTNLVSNAIRYTETGGSVTVSARQEGDEVVVEVIDTGIGISEEDQPRIYERFYRTDEGKKAVTFGIGLGLAITRDLVSSMAGTIEVRSQLGVGSTFRVALPAADVTEQVRSAV
ncbi:MAG TPA: ATP-binding protein [Dehalococcoidia bacterium]|nr:ATP-binding protein [Dehalococcoidia bacterium]